MSIIKSKTLQQLYNVADTFIVGKFLGANALAAVGSAFTLMIQGLVNSFGTIVMAAFAVAVKIDSFAYMPVQDFGNAFSIFIAQNFGANQTGRIKKGIKSALGISICFSVLVFLFVWIFAEPLMKVFIDPNEMDITGQ